MVEKKMGGAVDSTTHSSLSSSSPQGMEKIMPITGPTGKPLEEILRDAQGSRLKGVVLSRGAIDHLIKLAAECEDNETAHAAQAQAYRELAVKAERRATHFADLADDTYTEIERSLR